MKNKQKNNQCNSPLQIAATPAVRQQAATAVVQLPEAPGMQREPRRAAAQTCVREQRALSVPRKQPRGGIHPIGPSAVAAAGGAQRRPGEGAQRRDSAWQQRKDPLLRSIMYC